MINRIYKPAEALIGYEDRRARLSLILFSLLQCGEISLEVKQFVYEAISVAMTDKKMESSFDCIRQIATADDLTTWLTEGGTKALKAVLS